MPEFEGVMSVPKCERCCQKGTRVDVKDAVKIAKAWVADMLGDEGITNVGLEEVDFDERENAWLITIGFSRPWNTARGGLTAITGELAAKRAYRIITVKEPNGNVTSMRKVSES